VVGIPDASGDETAVACVLTKPSAERSEQLIQELLAACGDILEDHGVPSRVMFLDELPTVLGGAKVQRSELRWRLIKQMDDAGGLGASEIVQ